MSALKLCPGYVFLRSAVPPRRAFLAATFLLACILGGCTNISAAKQREILALWSALLQHPVTDSGAKEEHYQLQQCESCCTLIAHEASWQELFDSVGLQAIDPSQERVSLSLEASSMESLRAQLQDLSTLARSTEVPQASRRSIVKILRPNHIPATLLAQQLQSSFNHKICPCYVGTDPNHNLLFLRGPATNVANLIRELQQLDVPPTTILLEVVLLSQRVIDEWQMQPSASFKQGPIALDLFPQAAAIIGDKVPETAGGGKLQIAVVDRAKHPSAVSVNISNFLQDGRSFSTKEISNSISRPHLAVLGGSTAKLHIGNTGYRVFAEESPAQSTSIATRALPVGTSISVTPQELGDGEIELALSVEASRFIFNATLLANRNYSSSTVKLRVRPREAVHIAGLRLFKQRSELRTFSLLRSLPWLGSWLGDIAETNKAEAYDVFIFAHAPRGTAQLRGPADL